MARCTVARLMGQMGLQGAVRGGEARTTVINPVIACPLDRVNRQFRAPRPNALWLSDFTYVVTGRASSMSSLSSTPMLGASWAGG